MTEYELLGLWAKARLHIIVSQLAPTFLLIVTVALLFAGLDEASVAVRVATAGILLASGVLGAVAQISAANEAIAVADDLSSVSSVGAVTRRIVAQRPWVNVVRFVSPTIFVVIYLALLLALFI
ncbi:hypothetical protein B0I08_106139 [Glaciihabitans tibetensis]|uniref:Uncharacterized protein n=1 Tax=Glaciihabitans tibetensis TaxID=1266600 RepID=A0A2T0VBG4_9MICO|nr:hypothetical protein [Glaciihabitans tibetensis]PRY67532.1 hypothetical protein B0I08_106139 [Glaciihabitans tibetensis]